MRFHLICACVLLGAVLSCSRRQSSAAEDPAVPPPSLSLETPQVGPFRCQRDADCPPLPCGPCVPGSVIEHETQYTQCPRNPCLNAGTQCSPQHVCVVREGTVPDPAMRRQ